MVLNGATQTTVGVKGDARGFLAFILMEQLSEAFLIAIPGNEGVYFLRISFSNYKMNRTIAGGPPPVAKISQVW